MDVVVVLSNVVVLIVQAGLNHVSQILCSLVSLNLEQGQVNAGDNHSLLGVEQFGADNNLVDGDGGLNCVVGKGSSKNCALDVRAGKPFSHLVGSGLLVAHGSDSEMVSQVGITVAEVGGLDDFDVLVLFALKLGKWDQVSVSSDKMFWDW